MKTFRKSSLISSIALLLVAIVALSGATFAWFSNNNTAAAGKLDMTATSGSGLFIVESDLTVTDAPDEGWSSKITWTKKSENMNPVSGTLDGTTSFFKTSTDNADGTWNGEADINVAETADYIVKRIWVKADDAAEKTLTLTPTVTGGKGYERIAIVDMDGNATIMAAAVETYDAFISTAKEDNTAEVTTVTYATGASFTDTFDTAKYYDVYCWFEGQDADCINAKSSSNFTVDLAFGI